MEILLIAILIAITALAIFCGGILYVLHAAVDSPPREVTHTDAPDLPVQKFLRLKKEWRQYAAGRCFRVGEYDEDWIFEEADPILYPDTFEFLTFDPNETPE